jgi:two-component system sensor histidine kinase/response regulator
VNRATLHTHLRTRLLFAVLAIALTSVSLWAGASAIQAPLVAAAAIVALVLAAAIVVPRQFIEPIADLTIVAKRLAAGDLSVQVRVGSNDEVGQHSSGFNTMTTQLRQTLETLERRNQKLHLEISERKQAEKLLRQYVLELQARNDDLDAFSYTVAHDLKNLLGILVGYAEVLQSSSVAPSPEVMAQHLNTIARNARKMNDILDALLLLAGLGQDEVEFAALDMGAIVAVSQDRLAHMIQEYQAEIQLPARWPEALGYGPWVEEVWVNYLSNALKYGGPRPCIELGATVLDEGRTAAGSDSQRVQFWIRDNGPGLTKAEQERVFFPLVRIEACEIDGHGLGLAIVQRIVEKMDGEVGVESQPGLGCVFSFTLPRA